MRKLRPGFDDRAALQLAAPVLDRVDRGTQVRLDRQLQAAPRPPGATSSASTRTTPVGSPERQGQLDRDLGSPDARRTADRHETADARRDRQRTGVRDGPPGGRRRSVIARTNASGAASDSTSASTPSATRCSRLGGSSRSCTPTTARPCACTSATSARVSRRPTMPGDEHVVRLFERALGLDEQRADPGTAVIGEVPVQLLDPDVGRERQRDLGLSHFVLSGANGVCPCRRGAPVERTSITVPASIADASAGAVDGIDDQRDRDVVGRTRQRAAAATCRPRRPRRRSSTYPARPES